MVGQASISTALLYYRYGWVYQQDQLQPKAMKPKYLELPGMCY